MTIQPGEIYFVREIDRETKAFTNLVKIGLVRQREGRDSFDRLHEHQTGNPRKLQILAPSIVQTEAVDRVEALLHQFYASKRVSGEWFEFDSEAEIQDAIGHAKNFAQEVARLVPFIHEAARLRDVHDNGLVLEATEDVERLFHDWRTAKLELERWDKLNKLIAAKFKAAVEKGADLGEAAQKLQVVKEATFNLDEFEKAEPALYAKYLVQTVYYVPKFLPNSEAKKAVSLAPEIAGMYDEIQAGIESITKVEETINLNEYVTRLAKHKSSADWIAETSEAQLKVALGEAQAIEGICTWKRQPTLKPRFDEGLFQTENPGLWAEFLTDPITKTYILPKRRKAD